MVSNEFDLYSRDDLICEIIKLRRQLNLNESIKEGIKAGLQDALGNNDGQKITLATDCMVNNLYCKIDDNINETKASVAKQRDLYAQIYDFNQELDKLFDLDEIPHAFISKDKRFNNCEVMKLNPFKATQEDLDKLKQNVELLKALLNAYEYGLSDIDNTRKRTIYNHGKLDMIREIKHADCINNATRMSKKELEKFKKKLDALEKFAWNDIYSKKN